MNSELFLTVVFLNALSLATNVPLHKKALCRQAYNELCLMNNLMDKNDKSTYKDQVALFIEKHNQNPIGIELRAYLEKNFPASDFLSVSPAIPLKDIISIVSKNRLYLNYQCLPLAWKEPLAYYEVIYNTHDDHNYKDYQDCPDYQDYADDK